MPRRTPPDPDVEQARDFPEARSVHEAILDDPEEYPKGWVEQARFRDRYDLPPFRPPRLSDGGRLDEVVADLRSKHGVDVGFVERYVGDGWYVEVDGEVAFPVDRYRDDAANTVVGLDRADFVDRVAEALDR
jgi:hypothetical protein